MRGERGGAERQVALGLRVLVAHQAEWHGPAVDHLHVFVVVTEQFRSFQIVHGIPAIAEDIGERAHIRPFVRIVGAQHFVGRRIWVASAFNGDFRIFGCAVPPSVIVAQHGRIDDRILTIDPFDWIGECFEVNGCRVIHVRWIAQLIGQRIRGAFGVALRGPEHNPLLAVRIPICLWCPGHACAGNFRGYIHKARFAPMDQVGGVPDHQSGRAVRGGAVVWSPTATVVDAQIGGHNVESAARVAHDMRVAHALLAALPRQRRTAGRAQIPPMHAVAAQREVQLLIGGIALFADEMYEQIGLGVDAHDAPRDSLSVGGGWWQVMAILVAMATAHDRLAVVKCHS